MPASLGSTTLSTFLNEVEAHKLHLEFEVAAAVTVRKGGPVKLNAAGQVVPLVALDNYEQECIGVSIHEGEATELVTVGMRGYACIWAETQGALSAGPVEWANYDAASTRHEYIVASSEARMCGWNLDQAAAADAAIRVVVRT